MTESALDRARLLLADVLGMPVADLPVDAGITTLAAWDSLAHVRIALRVEEETGHALDLESVLSLRDVKSVAKVLGQGDAR